MTEFVRPAAEGTDVFGTGRLRGAVLGAWAASAARLREDANAEEDLALGGYRDRVVVELAQNAADAAARAGVPGRLRIALRDSEGDNPPVLAVANSGAALDEAGVESLSTLRASAKREDGTGTVGRFGVGFAAVLAVTDEPAVVARTGGVRWSLQESREAVRALGDPALDEEVRRRDGHVPLLRLPFPAEGMAPEGYDTVVILPLRDAVAEDLVTRLLAGIDDALLLTLPGLEEIVVETPDGTRVLRRRVDGPHTVIEDDGEVRRWRTVSHGGPLDAGLLAGRPVEERARPFWAVTWAVPVDSEGAPEEPRTAPVVHAPTPSDEPLGVPALLITTLPLDTARRHAAPGPITDFLVERAADAYAELLADWQPVTESILDLVPGPLGKAELDGKLRAAIVDRLPRTAFLPPALPHEGEEPGQYVALRPIEAEVVEGVGAETVTVLAEVLPSLLPGGLERSPALRTLGIARVPLTEAVDRLAGMERAPSWWHTLYESLAGIDPDRLTGLPVPLASGRTAIGPRAILLPPPGTWGGPQAQGSQGGSTRYGAADGDGYGATGRDDENGSHSGNGPGRGGETGPDLAALARLGLKIAHPAAAHPLLEKLGALPASPRAVLTTPQVRAAVAASLDDEGWDDGLGEQSAPDAEELAELVLALVRDAGLDVGDEPWLGALALPDEDGELAPAGELVLPGGAFAQVMREGALAAVDQEVAARWGERPLAACGVLVNFALVRANDVVLDPDELEPREGDYAEPDDPGLLDAVDVWCEDVLDRLPDSPVPPVATELVAVRDLDLVDEDRWPQALALLSKPPLRDALSQPVRVLLPDGTTESVRPYTAWWLRGHPVLDGRRPAGLRAVGGDELLAGLYDEVDAAGFEDAQVLRALGVRTSVAALLDEPGGAAELLDRLADQDRPVLAARLHGLYGALADVDPEEVTLPDELRAVVDGEVRVVDAAEALVADAPDLLPLTEGRALLPVPPARAAELAELLQVRRVSETVTAEVAEPGTSHPVPDSVRVLLGPATPEFYVEHEELIAGGTALDWRRTPDGTVHAATLEGVAAGLAWAVGQWPRRFEVAALLEDPSRTEELERDRWFD
ncbi:sacsin N-terminal ATP-binding-like domain-containing protein [Streptomyces tsukubensis]|uniref:Molecular chaperone Hsp90 n=1 Tax=Streptomyces tsukubensis TaxID=83656 RepID=A0A1V4A0E1_9ACTN|nr:molecular chaperone Hsp90 [Streptomyces tsukubensis]OON72320.1 molecular chaperone Hsp90 [Streptomyces tsukubensis]QFR94177.1 molecular chaperone Hsp90 [Streptomyces tsukubensis]